MARFYDSIRDSDLKRIEDLLKLRGIEYSLQVWRDGATVMKEIQVAEEDMAAAENLLYSASSPGRNRRDS